MDVEISTDRTPDFDRLIELFAQAGWNDKLDRGRLHAMVSNSTVVATAWAGDRMVGFEGRRSGADSASAAVAELPRLMSRWAPPRRELPPSSR